MAPRLSLRYRLCGHLRRPAVETLEDRRMLSVGPFPVPLHPAGPPGSLVYGGWADAEIAAPGNTHDFTIDVDHDQTLTVLVDPDTTLQPTIALAGPGGQQLGSAAAAAAGEDALLQVVPAAVAGTYILTVAGASDSTGEYTVELVLNSAMEAESHHGPANDTAAEAEDLDGGFAAAGDASAERAAVSGGLTSSEDWYRFTLGDGQSAALALKVDSPQAVTLELYDDGGQRLAAAVAADNFDWAINRFVDATADGSGDAYFARVAGQPAGRYCLVVTRGAALDTEPNAAPAAAQELAGSGAVLGHLGRPSSGQKRISKADAGDSPGQAMSPDVKYAPDRLIVRFAASASDADRAKALADRGGKVIRQLPLIDGVLVQAAKGPQLAAAWSDHPAVLYAQPDYLVHASEIFPDDPSFSTLWGLHNTGQSGGTPDADVDAPQAWEISTGSSTLVVADVDTGVDYTHEDLAANMWVNPGETADDGIDNDGNGYIDDVYGIDVANGDSDPQDDHGHGTHTAGTIGAVGNNSLGIAGVNWDVRIMALKFLDADGSGWSSDAITCLQYMTRMKTEFGVNVVASNNSWGGEAYEQALKDAIQAGNDAGILFIAAAGNGGSDGVGDDCDVQPHYPAGYDLDGIISVAAGDRRDRRPEWSNYGATSVDLAAPGASILSTIPGDLYGKMSGTSMAAPHVTGAVALLAAGLPEATPAQVKAAILDSVDPLPDFSTVTLTGGRLNLAAAMQMLADPNDDYLIAIQAGQTLSIATSTPADGPYEFANRLDPAVELYAPDDTLAAADDNSAPDGRNVLLEHTAAATGVYTVRVLADVARGGEYVLDVAADAAAAPLPFAAAATDPADGAPMRVGQPVRISVDFGDLVLLSSLDAWDLTFGGVPAAAVTVVDGDTAAFDFPAGADEGRNPVSLAAGAVCDLQGTPVEPFSATLWGFQDMLEVSTATDAPDGNYDPGELGLREALAVAAAMDGEDVVLFDYALSGSTIRLDAALGQLAIHENVQIIGPGAELLTVDAAGGSRVFEIAKGTTAGISGLTITGGHAEEGAGIYNQGYLGLIGAVISGNSADHFGGGLSSQYGVVSINNTTISGNSAGLIGGGIHAYFATVMMADSAVWGNSAVRWGGAIYQSSGNVSVRNSTFSGNSSGDGGGLYVFGPEATTTLVNSTVSENSALLEGGGILSWMATTTLHNTVVAGNSSQAGPSGGDLSGPFDEDSSHNLIGVIDGSTGMQGTGTLFGTTDDPLDPMLGPLRDNGGLTLTHALLPGSPALDAGSDDRATEAGLTGDQRWSPRFLDGDGDGTATVDVGAFESEFISSATVVGRRIFYNRCAFDGHDPAANALDDQAIAVDKQPLLPGGTATFANYTGYARGINGLMVDIAGPVHDPTGDDFAFRVGNDDDPQGWADAPPPESVTVRPGEGAGGSHRVTIIWPDGAVAKQWLQVTVLATLNTGLVEADVFYYGNAIGESGVPAADAKVNVFDILGARDNQRSLADPAPIDFPFDYDRDAKVNATDMLIARNSQTHFMDALRLIAVPAAKSQGGATTENAAGGEMHDAVFAEDRRRLSWLHEYRQPELDRPARQHDAAAPAALLLIDQ